MSFKIILTIAFLIAMANGCSMHGAISNEVTETWFTFVGAAEEGDSLKLKQMCTIEGWKSFSDIFQMATPQDVKDLGFYLKRQKISQINVQDSTSVKLLITEKYDPSLGYSGVLFIKKDKSWLLNKYFAAK